MDYCYFSVIFIILRSGYCIILCVNVKKLWLQGLPKQSTPWDTLTLGLLVVSISSSQGIPIISWQIISSYLNNKNLILSFCGRKGGYRKEFCEKFVGFQKSNGNIDLNRIFFTNMDFEALQLFFYEIHYITVMP